MVQNKVEKMERLIRSLKKENKSLRDMVGEAMAAVSHASNTGDHSGLVDRLRIVFKFVSEKEDVK